MIKQRIIDNAFDDVEAKVAIEIKSAKKRADISDEKSKDGLGDILEQDYLKEALGVQTTGTQLLAVLVSAEVEGREDKACLCSLFEF